MRKLSVPSNLDICRGMQGYRKQWKWRGYRIHQNTVGILKFIFELVQLCLIQSCRKSQRILTQTQQSQQCISPAQYNVGFFSDLFINIITLTFSIIALQITFSKLFAEVFPNSMWQDIGYCQHWKTIISCVLDKFSSYVPSPWNWMKLLVVLCPDKGKKTEEMRHTKSVTTFWMPCVGHWPVRILFLTDDVAYFNVQFRYFQKAYDNT